MYKKEGLYEGHMKHFASFLFSTRQKYKVTIPNF